MTDDAMLMRMVAWRRSGRADLAGDLVHGLGQPLSCIRGFAEALRLVADDGRPFEAAHIAERMRHIIAETDAIDALLQEARSADRTPGPHSADPAHAAAAVLRFTGRRMQAHGVRCRLSSNGPSARMAMPPEDLQEVVRILLANAEAACRQRHGRGGTIAIAVDTTGDPLLMSIGDDGCGMAPTVLARAGEPGFTTRPDGAGLGLAAARALLASWGGTLDLASTAGAGTTATIRLPRANQPRP